MERVSYHRPRVAFERTTCIQESVVGQHKNAGSDSTSRVQLFFGRGNASYPDFARNRRNMKQLKSWWEEKKLGNVLRPKEGSKQNVSNTLSSTPVKRFTINEGSSWRHASERRNQGRNGRSSSTAAAAGASSGLDSRNSASTSNSGIRYRKWGDALLPQVTTESGETVPMISYPACAPGLPPGMTPYVY